MGECSKQLKYCIFWHEKKDFVSSSDHAIKSPIINYYFHFSHAKIICHCGEVEWRCNYKIAIPWTHHQTTTWQLPYHIPDMGPWGKEKEKSAKTLVMYSGKGEVQSSMAVQEWGVCRSAREESTKEQTWRPYVPLWCKELVKVVISLHLPGQQKQTTQASCILHFLELNRTVWKW